MQHEELSKVSCLIGFFIFILLFRESDGGAILRTIPDQTRLRVTFLSDLFNLLLVTFHQAGIIIVKHLIRGRKHEARVKVEPLTFRAWAS